MNTTISDPEWAWAAYAPTAAHPWGLPLAAHLCRRAGLGADWGGLQRVLADGPQDSVTSFLQGGAEAPAFNAAYDGYEQAAASSAEGLAAWWLRRMIESPCPLLERMTLFWHGHFGVSNARVGNPELVCRHLHQLRAQALGRFDRLLADTLKSPAVLLALNARNVRKARPEPSLARTVLEEYTVGPGQFSDEDVRAAARAFTGWHVSQWTVGYNPDEHDAGPKTLLGETGDWGREDVLRIVCQHPATARHVARELCRWFISESNPPPENVLAPLAAEFAKDYDLARLVERVLRSNLFFSALGEKIKSPVEFAVGILRAFSAAAPTLRLARDLAALGQDLLEPPTVKGWAGGRDWINRFTLLGRARLAQDLFDDSGPYAGKLDPEAAAAHGGPSAQAMAERLFDLLLPDQVGREAQALLVARVSSVDPPRQRVRQLAALIATLPEFNLA